MTATEMPAADVVVVGAGCGGLCAAVEAAEQGLSVVVLEKLSSSLGSSTAASGGYFAFVDTDLQRRQHVLDTDGAFRADMHRNDTGQSHLELVDLYLAYQLDTYYWLQEHNVVFWQADMGIGMNLPRCHATDPQPDRGTYSRGAAPARIHFLRRGGREGRAGRTWLRPHHAQRRVRERCQGCCAGDRRLLAQSGDARSLFAGLGADQVGRWRPWFNGRRHHARRRPRCEP